MLAAFSARSMRFFIARASTLIGSRANRSATIRRTSPNFPAVSKRVASASRATTKPSKSKLASTTGRFGIRPLLSRLLNGEVALRVVASAVSGARGEAGGAGSVGLGLALTTTVGLGLGVGFGVAVAEAEGAGVAGAEGVGIAEADGVGGGVAVCVGVGTAEAFGEIEGPAVASGLGRTEFVAKSALLLGEGAGPSPPPRSLAQAKIPRAAMMTTKPDASSHSPRRPEVSAGAKRLGSTEPARPGTSEDSSIRKSTFPKRSRSPFLRSELSTRTSLTKTPLEEPRSVTVAALPESTMRACCRETEPSRIGTAQSSRRPTIHSPTPSG
jgi:hypothetical protein